MSSPYLIYIPKTYVVHVIPEPLTVFAIQPSVNTIDLIYPVGYINVPGSIVFKHVLGDVFVLPSAAKGVSFTTSRSCFTTVEGLVAISKAKSPDAIKNNLMMYPPDTRCFTIACVDWLISFNEGFVYVMDTDLNWKTPEETAFPLEMIPRLMAAAGVGRIPEIGNGSMKGKLTFLEPNLAEPKKKFEVNSYPFVDNEIEGRWPKLDDVAFTTSDEKAITELCVLLNSNLSLSDVRISAHLKPRVKTMNVTYKAFEIKTDSMKWNVVSASPYSVLISPSTSWRCDGCTKAFNNEKITKNASCWTCVHGQFFGCSPKDPWCFISPGYYDRVTDSHTGLVQIARYNTVVLYDSLLQTAPVKLGNPGFVRYSSPAYPNPVPDTYTMLVYGGIGYEKYGNVCRVSFGMSPQEVYLQRLPPVEFHTNQKLYTPKYWTIKAKAGSGKTSSGTFCQLHVPLRHQAFRVLCKEEVGSTDFNTFDRMFTNSRFKRSGDHVADDVIKAVNEAQRLRTTTTVFVGEVIAPSPVAVIQNDAMDQ